MQHKMSPIRPNNQKRRRCKSQLVFTCKKSKTKTTKRQSAQRRTTKKTRRRVQSLIGIAKENKQIFGNNKEEWTNIIHKFDQNHRKSLSQLLYDGETNNNDKVSYKQTKAIHKKSIETNFLQKLQDEELLLNHTKNEKNHEIQYKMIWRKKDVFHKYQMKKKNNSPNRMITKWINEYEMDSKNTNKTFENFAMNKLELLNNDHTLRLPQSYHHRLKVAISCLILQNLFDSHLPSIHFKLKHLLKKEIYESIYCSLMTNNENKKKYNLKQLYESIPYFIVDKNIIMNEQKLLNNKNLLNDKVRKQKMDMIRGVFKAQDAFDKIIKFVKENNYLGKVLIEWKKYTLKNIGKRKIAISFCSKMLTGWDKKNALTAFIVWKQIILKKKWNLKQTSINNLKHDIELQKENKQRAIKQINDANQEIEILKSKLKEEQNKSLPFKFYTFPKSHKKFQSLLQHLRELKGELSEMVATIHFNLDLLNNGKDENNENIMDLNEEEIIMLWLKYQLQFIQIEQIRQRRKYLADNPVQIANTSSITTDDDTDISSTIEETEENDDKTDDEIVIDQHHNDQHDNKQHDNEQQQDQPMIEFVKIEQILENILLQIKYDNFDKDFQDKNIFLLLLYYLFDGNGFKDLSELLFLCDQQTNIKIKADKIMSLYAQLFDCKNMVNNNDKKQYMNIFINFGKIISNDINCNFVLLLKFMLKKSNIKLTNQDIALYKVRINAAMRQCSQMLNKMVNSTTSEASFNKEALKIEQVIDNIHKVKAKFMDNHYKFIQIQNKIQKRISRQSHNYKSGKFVFIHEPIYKNKIINKLVNINHYSKVKQIFQRYYKTESHVFDLALKDYREIPNIINQSLSIILYLLKTYFDFNNDQSSMTMTEHNWMKLCKDFNLNKSEFLMQKLFKQILNENEEIMDIQYLIPLLLYVSDIIYANESCKPSDKLYLLLQKHMLQIIHPRSDIISLSNMYPVQILIQQKLAKLSKLWSKLQINDEAPYNYAANDYFNFCGVLSTESFIQLLSQSTNHPKSMVISKCNDCSINIESDSKYTMDFEAFFGIICHIGQQITTDLEWTSLSQRISIFIDKL